MLCAPQLRATTQLYRDCTTSEPNNVLFC